MRKVRLLAKGNANGKTSIASAKRERRNVNRDRENVIGTAIVSPKKRCSKYCTKETPQEEVSELTVNETELVWKHKNNRATRRPNLTM